MSGGLLLQSRARGGWRVQPSRGVAWSPYCPNWLYSRRSAVDHDRDHHRKGKDQGARWTARRRLTSGVIRPSCSSCASIPGVAPRMSDTPARSLDRQENAKRRRQSPARPTPSDRSYFPSFVYLPEKASQIHLHHRRMQMSSAVVHCLLPADFDHAGRLHASSYPIASFCAGPCPYRWSLRWGLKDDPGLAMRAGSVSPRSGM